MIFEYESFSYEKPDADLSLIKGLYSKLCEWTVESENKLNIKSITINQSIAYDVIRKTFEDMLRYRKSYNPHQKIDIPDHFKEAAHFAYWIRRLKPFSFEPDLEHQVNFEYQKNFIKWINECIALHIMEFLCVQGEIQHHRSPNTFRFPERLKNDFLHMFRYKHVSPHALMLILRSIY